MASLGDWIVTWARAGLGGAIADQAGTLNEAAKEGGDETGKSTIGNLNSGAGGLFGVVGTLGAFSNTFLSGATGLAKWVIGVGEGWALGSFMTEAFRPLWIEITHDIAAAITSEIVDPATAAELVAKRIIADKQGQDEAGGGNLNAGRFEWMVDSKYLQPGLGEVLEMLRRGIASTDDVVYALNRAGYDPSFVSKLEQLAPQLLSPADLALASLRGIIDEAAATNYAARLGVSSDDLQTLIGNTGEPPGLMELLEAYRRGFIDTPRLERGIRQSRVRNEWIDVVEKLRFSPMSTADAVRAVIENYLPDDQGKQIATQNGLDPDHWVFLREAYGRPLAHEQMASLVHRGLASREQFDQAMRESDIKDKYIDQSFQVATPLLPQRTIVSAIRFGALDLQAGAAMLLKLGYDADAVAVLLKLGLHEQNGAAKDLTKAQIVTLYEDGILHRQAALDHLVALRYSQADAEYMLQLADYAGHAKQIRLETQATRIGYLAGHIDKVTAENQLVNAGVLQAQAVQTIALWDREKKRSERVLSPAQVVKAAKNQVLQPSEALRLLKAAGYSDSDATVLLETAGAVVGPGH